MLPHGPRVTADNLADSHASGVATHDSSSTPKPLVHMYVLGHP